jgi:hypothetical protein
MLKELVALLCLGVVLQGRAGHVVINEVMYHPPDDHDELQFVELLNPTTSPVDLSGWKLSGGVKFTFPPKTVLAPGAFLVVTRDSAAFQRTHGGTTVPFGIFTERLSHKGAKLELVDSSGQTVEKLHYHDGKSWPQGADGYGSSLERICVDAPADDPRNWAASHSPAGTRAGGSPGEVNSVASAKPLPVVQKVTWEKFTKPDQPLEIAAEVSGTEAIENVVLEYRTIRAARQTAAATLEMHKTAGDNGSNHYSATIPGQVSGTLIRFTVQARDKNGATRVEPAAAEPRPAFTAYALEKVERAGIPQLIVLNPEPLRGGGNNKFGPARKEAKGRGKSAILYIPPQGEIQLLDFVQVRRRAGGLKIHFLRDQPLADMTAVNVIFEGPPRWVLSEHLSYELYRKAGMKIENSGHVRLTVDNRALGYYLLVEQPNKHFLARSGRDESGNLYKVLWFGNGIVSQHEKKTNPETGHADIVSLIETLRSKTGAAQWAYINEQFDVDAFANYYAVNMCVENWDGFFNNHFVYHDLKPGGKWDILPWDEDKTWGEYDGGPQDYSWYDMPLTFGSGSDRARRGVGWFGGGGFDGYWRPPGFLSGALLSNPQFRQKFEARLRELCMTVFTPEKFGPVVQELQQRLRPEVELKARLTGQNPSSALKQFDGDMASFHRQLANRRKYILANLK